LWWWRVTNKWGITTKIATIYTKNEPNRTVTKCGIDTPSEPNSEIPTLPLLEAAGLHLYSLARLMLFAFFVSKGSLVLL